MGGGEGISPVKVRVHVGGLGEAVTADELRRMFQLAGGGSVTGLHFVRTKGRSFAYVDFSPSSHNSLSKIFAKYNGCVWKGGRLRLEKAKEHYLDRLRREWAEDAAAVAVADANSATPDSSELRPTFSVADKSNLRIFFPRLRKVKLLPFSGTGKHKYSFQRVEVPSLPKYFCDCEEHAGPFSAEKEKRISHQQAEPESGGMSGEELSIMNKVMNTLFQKQNDCSVDNGTLPANSGDNSFQLSDALHFDEDEADEDNLILNVVSKGNEDMLALLGRQQRHQVDNQETRSRRRPLQDSFKVQKGNDSEAPNKKKKSLSHDKSSGNSQKRNDNETLNKKEKLSRGKEFESSISATANKGNLQSHSNKLGKHRTVQPTEPELGKLQSSVHVCYQKSSWKELVGCRGSDSFSISSILSGIASSEEDLQRTAAPNVSDSNSEKENLEKNEIASIEEGQLKFEVSNEPESENKHENLEGDRESKGTLCTKETEGLVEGQPAESKVVSTHTGRGASWRHKSSWTQLVAGNASFSMSQLFGGATFDQQLSEEPKVAETVKSANGKFNEMSNSARDFLSTSGTEQEDDVRTTQAENQQTSLGNDEPSMSAFEENHGVAANQIPASKVEISDNCSFMRNASSLKEWAKSKAALSYSIKRKRNQQE